MNTEVEMQSFTASDGLTLRYVFDDYTDPWRKPDTLVLVHAAMGSSRRFYAWVPHLARDYRVVRLDQRGHGQSGIPTPEQMTFKRLGKDVVKLIDHLRLESVNLAGSSAGGIVSQSVAIDYPQRVKSLASYAAPPGMKMGRQDYNGWLAKIDSKGLAAFLRETIADPIHLIDEYELLRSEIKQCEFVVYEGLPHNITDTVPDRCAKELLRFLKSTT